MWQYWSKATKGTLIQLFQKRYTALKMLKLVIWCGTNGLSPATCAKCGYFQKDYIVTIIGNTHNQTFGKPKYCRGAVHFRHALKKRMHYRTDMHFLKHCQQCTCYHTKSRWPCLCSGVEKCGTKVFPWLLYNWIIFEETYCTSAGDLWKKYLNMLLELL